MPSSLRRYTSGLKRAMARASWIASLRRAGHRIHPSLEITGMVNPSAFVDIEPCCWIERDVTVWFSPDEGSDPKLSLKRDVFIGRNCYIGLYQPISIGACALIGAYSYIISGSHRYESREVPIQRQGFCGAPITIGEDVWIGTGVTVLPGVTIGKGAIVGAGSLVNRDIPEYEIWGGTPARYLKTRP